METKEPKEDVMMEPNHCVELHQSGDFMMMNFDLRQTALDEVEDLRQEPLLLSFRTTGLV